MSAALIHVPVVMNESHERTPVFAEDVCKAIWSGVKLTTKAPLSYISLGDALLQIVESLAEVSDFARRVERFLGFQGLTS